MSDSYTKLFPSLLTSTVWLESAETRLVWITMLALADRDGLVEASVPGLAKLAGVSREACDEALRVFSSPDPDSRSKREEGRRIVAVDGGWLLVNHLDYRQKASAVERREKATLRQRRLRERNASVRNRNAQSRSVTPHTQCDDTAEAEAEAEAEADKREPPVGPPAGDSTIKKPKRAKLWRRVPEPWQPTDEHRRIAAEERKDFERELAMYRDHEFRSPKSDADAAFRTWLRRAPQANGVRAPPSMQRVRAGDMVASLVERANRLAAEEKTELAKSAQSKGNPSDQR